MGSVYYLNRKRKNKTQDRVFRACLHPACCCLMKGLLSSYCGAGALRSVCCPSVDRIRQALCASCPRGGGAARGVESLGYCQRCSGASRAVGCVSTAFPLRGAHRTGWTVVSWRALALADGRTRCAIATGRARRLRPTLTTPRTHVPRGAQPTALGALQPVRVAKPAWWALTPYPKNAVTPKRTENLRRSSRDGPSFGVIPFLHWCGRGGTLGAEICSAPTRVLLGLDTRDWAVKTCRTVTGACVCAQSTGVAICATWT